VVAKTAIDTYYDRGKALLEYLAGNNETSFQNQVESDLRKSLLLSIASYFESQIKATIEGLVSNSTNGAEVLLSFVKSTAIERQYHTYFDWNAKNANKFFKLFGQGFGEYMREKVKADRELSEAITAFLELGQDRNRLVHDNYVAFPLEKTAAEIYKTYESALRFVEELPQFFGSYVESQVNGADDS